MQACGGGCSGGEPCAADADHAQAATDDDCAPCGAGQTWWPCNVAGLCYCKGTGGGGTAAAYKVFPKEKAPGADCGLPVGLQIGAPAPIIKTACEDYS